MSILSSYFGRMLGLPLIPIAIGIGCYEMGHTIIGVVLIAVFGLLELLAIVTLAIIHLHLAFLLVWDWLMGGHALRMINEGVEPVHPVIQRVVIVRDESDDD